MAAPPGMHLSGNFKAKYGETRPKRPYLSSDWGILERALAHSYRVPSPSGHPHWASEQSPERQVLQVTQPTRGGGETQTQDPLPTFHPFYSTVERLKEGCKNATQDGLSDNVLDPEVLVRVCFVSPELALDCAALPAQKTVQR